MGVRNKNEGTGRFKQALNVGQETSGCLWAGRERITPTECGFRERQV